MTVTYNCVTMPNGQTAEGCLPRDTEFGSEQKVYEQEFALHPRTDWPDLIRKNESFRKLVVAIKNQKQEGSCACNMTTLIFEIIWVLQFGFSNFIEFSPISIYRWLANGPNQGTTISGNLRHLTNVGVLPVRSRQSEEMLEKMGLPTNHTLEATGWGQKFPNNWEETASYFRALEAFDIGSFDGIVSASLDGWPIGYGRAGHAIACVSPYQQNGYGLDYANSWSPQWGNEGYGRDTESFVSRAIASYGAWALRAVRNHNKIQHLLMAA